jgi:hypothetical protein
MDGIGRVESGTETEKSEKAWYQITPKQCI